MHRSVNLYRRTKEGEAADEDRTNVEYDTIEVEEHPLAQLDVRTVIAEERRLHPYGVSARTEQFAKDLPPFLLLRISRGIEGLAEIARKRPSCCQLGVRWVI